MVTRCTWRGGTTIGISDFNPVIVSIDNSKHLQYAANKNRTRMPDDFIKIQNGLEASCFIPNRKVL